MSSNKDETSNLHFREADIAVRLYRPKQLDLVTLHLGDLGLGVFAAKSYVERCGMPRTPAEFMTHDIIGFDSSNARIEGFRALGYDVTRDFFKVRCDAQGAYWQLVVAGAGIGFAQRSSGASGSRRGRDPARPSASDAAGVPQRP